MLCQPQNIRHCQKYEIRKCTNWSSDSTRGQRYWGIAGSHFAQKISLGPILLWTIRRRQLCRLPIHESDGEVQMTALILRWGLCLICWPPKPHNFPRKINWLWLCWRHMMIIGVHLLWTWHCSQQATLPKKFNSITAPLRPQDVLNCPPNNPGNENRIERWKLEFLQSLETLDSSEIW